MQDVALITDADVQDKDSTDKVSLMTVHAAKGLEFPYIFIVGMEENLFPSIQSLSSRATWRRNAGCFMWHSPGLRKKSRSLLLKTGTGGELNHL